MRPAYLLVLASAFTCAWAAEVCNPANVHGAYGFVLTGTTTIGSQPQPVVSAGRLVFDGMGGVSGVSSVSFTGLYLGNPVTGQYQAREDCSVSWSLQDDSGNSQHFEGTLTPDARHAQFHQSDPGSPSQGTLVKSADMCQEQSFRPRYRFALSGKRINVPTGQPEGPVSARGVLENQGGQLNLTLTPDSATSGTGTVEVEDDCFVHLHVTLPTERGGTAEMNFRGILVDGGSELLGMATDPGSAISLRLTAPSQPGPSAR